MKKTLLRNYMARQGVSVAEIAAHCGISESYASRIINNRAGDVKPEILEHMARYLKLPPSELNRLCYTFEAEEKGKTIFQEDLYHVLSGIAKYDRAEADKYHRKIAVLKPDAIALYENYIKGYDGWRFMLEDKPEKAIECFKEAQNFKAGSELEVELKRIILRGLGEGLMAKGYYREGMKALRKGLMGNSKGKGAGWIYLQMGVLFKRRGNLGRALEAYREARTLGDAPVRMLALSAQSQLERHRDKVLSGQLLIEALQKVEEDSEGLKLGGAIYCSLGETLWKLGAFDRAKVLFKESIRHAMAEGDLRSKHRAMIRLGNVYAEKNEQDLLSEIVRRIEEEIDQEADSVNVWGKSDLLGLYHMRNEAFDVAKTALQEAYRIGQLVKLPFETMASCRGLRACHSALGEWEAADFYGSEEKRIRKLIRIR